VRWLPLILLVGCAAAPPDPVDPTPTPDEGPAPCSLWNAPRVTGTVDSGELDEISGIVVGREQPDRLYVIEDSGAAAEVWALTVDGDVADRYVLNGADNVDWEDLTMAPCGDGWCLWLADVGDNAAARDEVVLYRIEEPEPGALVVDAIAHRGRYPDGAHDVEGVAWAGDELLAFTKRTGNRTEVFAWSDLTPEGVHEAELRAEVDTDSGDGVATLGVTAADITDEGDRLLLRGYFDLRWWDLGEDLTLDVADSTAVPFVPEGQGEAAAWDPHRRGVWTVGESPGGRPPLHFTPCAN